MNSILSAIETNYKGYHFRSRLEARWAVYFDTLEIGWEYEPEGFELGSIGRYLPDFWLNLLGGVRDIECLNMWAEVKPGPFDPKAIAKAEALVLASGHRLLMLEGIPEERIYFSMERIELYEKNSGHFKVVTSPFLHGNREAAYAARYVRFEGR